MLILIRDIRSGSDVLINSEYVSSVERDQLNAEEFHVRMINHEIYTVIDKDASAWLTMQRS